MNFAQRQRFLTSIWIPTSGDTSRDSVCMTLVLSVAANQFMKRVQGFWGSRGAGILKILIGTSLCGGHYIPPLIGIGSTYLLRLDEKSQRPHTFRQPLKRQTFGLEICHAQCIHEFF